MKPEFNISAKCLNLKNENMQIYAVYKINRQLSFYYYLFYVFLFENRNLESCKGIQIIAQTFNFQNQLLSLY